MKIICKLFSFIIGVIYFLCAGIGSLLVLPCNVVSALCCLAGVILLISGGFVNWREYLPCFGIGILIYIIPIVLVSGLGKLLLWIDENCFRKY